MKRVLIVNEWIIGGGVEKVMKDLVTSLPETEYRVTLASLFNDRKCFKQVYPDSIKYIQLKQAYRQDSYPSRSIGHVTCALWRRLFQKVAQIWFSLQNYDVVVAMEEGSCMKLLSKVRAKKKLAWVHCDFETNYWTKGIFPNEAAERACMEKYDRVVCVSETVAEHLKNVVGDPGNVCVRYNPVDEKAIRRTAQEKVDLPSPQKAPLFVTVGRLCEAKGYDRLQRICKRLDDEALAYEIWIVGDGELAENLFSQKKALQLDNVHYLGNKSNPFPYMKQADWVLCSSITEGFSTVLQEATVLGVPIISTKCSGTEELLGKSEYGIVVENSEEALYEGMKRVILDAGVLLHYREKAAERQNFVNLQNRILKIKELL